MKRDDWDEDAAEFFEERAAIREYVGGQTRAEAEAGAERETVEYVARRDAVKRCS